MPEYNGRTARRTLRQYCEENPNVAFILDEWHTTKNGDLTPDDVSPSSKMPVWWRCKKGHVWQTQAASRTGGSGCPKCREEALRKKREEKYKAAKSRGNGEKKDEKENT